MAVELGQNVCFITLNIITVGYVVYIVL